MMRRTNPAEWTSILLRVPATRQSLRIADPDGLSGRFGTLLQVTIRRVPGDVLIQLRRARDHADRHYTEPLDLETLAAIACVSKFHFQRLFTVAYGLSPAAYLSERRIERAQDLLRTTNLTVTEICHAVGFSSLGSFSSRFRELVGESPSEFQRRYAAAGAPRIPGCWVFMAGLAERAERPTKPATTIRKPGEAASTASTLESGS